jgi:hypothetical protein
VFGQASLKKSGRSAATFANGFFTGQLARPPDRLGLLARPLFGWLFKVIPQFHLTEHAFALHLFLQRLQGLINIIIAYNNLQLFGPVDLGLEFGR